VAWARRENPLSYTELKHLPDIIGQNWEDFEPYVLRVTGTSRLASSYFSLKNPPWSPGRLG
jgi:hypothetical protein